MNKLSLNNILRVDFSLYVKYVALAQNTNYSKIIFSLFSWLDTDQINILNESLFKEMGKMCFVVLGRGGDE